MLRRGPRKVCGPGLGWASGRRRLAEHTARCLSCGVADGVVNQVVNKVGPSCTAHGSSELVKAHTKRHRRQWAQLGPRAARGPRKLCVDACISAPPAPGPFGNRGPRAGRRSCVTRSGPTRLRMRISASPAAGQGGPGLHRAGGAA